jgi:uncharacterized protein (DUF952 family)
VQIFHIAEAKRWEAAKLAGSYAQSTLGRTLDEVGFIHAARADQVDRVREEFYGDVTEPLVLLVIETDLLTSPWREDPVGDETFPHIHGPLNPGAVVSALPLGGTPTAQATEDPAPASAGATQGATAAGPAAQRPSQTTFMRAFLGEMFFRMLMAAVVMLIVLVALAVAESVGIEPLIGIGVGFLVGIPLVLLVARRRNRRLAAA